MKRINLTLLLSIYIVKGSLFAQEVTEPLQFNPVIRQYLAVHGQQAAQRVSAVADTLFLPFLDDFSEPGIYPSQQRWMDNKVFINSDLPRVLPTVGAATFDGLDETGNPYMPGNSVSGAADVLTSVPLHLLKKPNNNGNYTLADSIYISFYYEKKGYGDAPDASDSLVLEFFRPSTQSWYRAWYTMGGVTSGQDTVFNKVDVLVTNASFLEEGFQFRFRNYGNLSGSLDHWHIDYVRVFSLVGSTVLMNDQAFIDDRSSLLQSFTAIPWKHYKAAASQSALLAASGAMKYIVNVNSVAANAGFVHRTYAYNGDSVGGFGLPNTLFPVTPNQRSTYIYPINYVYPNSYELTDDSSWFDVVDCFSSALGGDEISSNDSIRHRQYFFNYYSSDDGTCELGYDLVNAANGKVAMRFDMLQADTLRGVQIFFTQQNTVVSNKLMTIKVWSTLSPENVLYQLPNSKPDYVDSINGFATYLFNMNVPVTSFYIGMQQVAPDGLHLGFDRNTSSNSRMYYNTSGTWSQVSVLSGSFMIRPLVGAGLLAGVKENQKTDGNIISVYPNPAGDYIYINTPVNIREKRVMITDIAGRVVYDDYYNGQQLDVSFLSPGIYNVLVKGVEFNSVAGRLVISR